MGASPRNLGEVVHINARQPGGEFRALDEARVTCEGGMLSDEWARLPLEERHRSRQLTLIDVRVARLITHGMPLGMTGDNFFVDFDVSTTHVPMGSLLRVGSLVLQVSADTYVGDERFAGHFGREAAEWVNDARHRFRRLRGIFCKVVGPGLVCRGDSIQAIRGSESNYPDGRPWLAVQNERVVFKGENGRAEAEGYVVEGKQHGLWRYYRSSGMLHLEGQYRSGTRVGRWRGYWDSGTLAWIMRYDDGRRSSGEFYTPPAMRDELLEEALAQETFAFDAFEPEPPVVGPTNLVARAYYTSEVGRIAKLELLNTAGVVTKTRTWREDGVELQTEPIVTEDGEWKVTTCFHQSGHRQCEERTLDGVLDGESSYWDVHGNLERLCVYENGTLKITRYYDAGILSSMTLHLPDGSERTSQIRRVA